MVWSTAHRAFLPLGGRGDQSPLDTFLSLAAIFFSDPSIAPLLNTARVTDTISDGEAEHDKRCVEHIGPSRDTH